MCQGAAKELVGLEWSEQVDSYKKWDQGDIQVWDDSDFGDMVEKGFEFNSMCKRKPSASFE